MDLDRKNRSGGKVVPNLRTPADRLRVDGIANSGKKDKPDEPANDERIVLEDRPRDIDE